MQHFFDVSGVLLLLVLAICDAYWRLPRRPEPIIVTESTGSLTFNSSLESAPVTYQEWILSPSAHPNRHGRPPLLRIFVEEILLEAEGDQCPTNKRITIGNADQPDNQDSVAYCKHLRNFEISVIAHRVFIRLQCPPDDDGPVYFRLHYGLVVPSAQETGLQRPGRQVCRDPFHDKGSDGLHSHLWACRPVFYGQLSETQCLTTDQICNGFEDCPSGEDESPATCNKETATVIETIHSLSNWLNTTQANWPASSDANENSAGTLLNIALHPCHPGEFQCKVRDPEESQTSFVCISSAWLCDGHCDCPQGEDEATELCSNQKAPVGGCPPHTFSCSYDAKCLDQRFICDGTQDCFGSRDESAAACAWKKEHRPTPPDGHPQQNSNVTGTKDLQIDRFGFHANVTVSVSIEWGLVNRLCPPEKPYLCRYSQTCLPLSSLCNGKVECPDQLDESVLMCTLFDSIKSAMENSTELFVPSTPDTCHGAPHTYPWVAGVYSRQCFLCYGVLISGANSSWWVIVPASCGKYLRPENLTVVLEKPSEPYRVHSREDQPNLQNASGNIPIGFSLLKIDLPSINTTTWPATNVTSNVTTSPLSSLDGFTFSKNPNETSRSICELITPVRCQPPVDGERFALQDVQLSDLSVCQQRYLQFTGFNTSGLVCVPQDICLQHNLGAILVCRGNANDPSKRLGFAIHGADCAQGQLHWPSIVSTTTEQTTAWIEVAIGNRTPKPPATEAICGYAPDGKFPWFVYFNMRSGRSYCLGVYVENKTFPLITSERCLKRCLRVNGLQVDCNLEPVGLPAISWLKNPETATTKPELARLKLPVVRPDTDMNVCPAKHVHERLANATSERPVWTRCILAYLHNSTSKAVGIELIDVQPFTACQGENFYLALRDKMLLCVTATGEQPLNCQHWTDAALVTCQRASTLQWELVGLAPACRSDSAFKWFLRVLPW